MHEPDLALLMNAAIIDSIVKYAWSDLRKFTQQIPATQANGPSIDRMPTCRGVAESTHYAVCIV